MVRSPLRLAVTYFVYFCVVNSLPNSSLGAEIGMEAEFPLAIVFPNRVWERGRRWLRNREPNYDTGPVE